MEQDSSSSFPNEQVKSRYFLKVHKKPGLGFYKVQ